MKYRILDLYCGAGGAALGYRRAGLEVVGVDIVPQPHYLGDVFILADALDFLARHHRAFHCFHASPPCKAHSKISRIHAPNHPDLIGATRQALRAMGIYGKPTVIENVPEAPLRPDVILCGTMFGLRTPQYQLLRHRHFELGCWKIREKTPPCDHWRNRQTVHIHGNPGGSSSRDGIKFASLGVWHELMQLPTHLTCKEVAQAIPPVYTEWLGHRLVNHLNSRT